jgi:hypothetical protein
MDDNKCGPSIQTPLGIVSEGASAMVNTLQVREEPSTTIRADHPLKRARDLRFNLT